MSHLDDGTLHALLDGEIPSTELSEVQAHLAACAECRTRLEQERLLVGEALDLVQMVEVPEVAPALAAAAQPAASLDAAARSNRVKRTNWTRGLAWAASMIGAVGLGYAARGIVAPSGAAPHALNESAQPVASDIASRQPDSALAEPRALEPKPQPAPSPRQNLGAANRARVRVDSTPRTRLDETRPAPTPPAPVDQNASGGAAARDARELSARADAPAFALMKLASPVEALTFPEALRRLEGSIRLIPGLIPSRLEAQGNEVRVVYPTAQGELILRQELVNGRLVFRLSGPPGFPADSLERLRARVRE
jgi:predicted anti-sigma-YlaC factor YlaD